MTGVTFFASASDGIQTDIPLLNPNSNVSATNPLGLPLEEAKSGGQWNVEWRTLYSHAIDSETDWDIEGNYGAVGSLVVANFDQDADDELLLLRVVESSLLFEMGGSVTEVALYGLGFIGGSRAWDYDNDGTFEIMPDPHGFSGDAMFFPGYAKVSNVQEKEQSRVAELPVFNLDYSVADLYPMEKMENFQTLGDFNGDGTLDLLYCKGVPSMDVFAENISGKTIWEFTLPVIREPSLVMFLCAGDFDGDGREEFFSPIKANRVYGMEQEPIDLGDLEYFSFPRFAADLNAMGLKRP